MALENTKFFISYRHKDSEEYALKLLSKLKLTEPSCKVFLDKSHMLGGFQYLEQIKTEISLCKVLLLLISPYWHTVEGKRRLYETDDVLLREILFAHRNTILVLPILIEGTQMPEKKELPEDLSWLNDFQGVPLSLKNLDNDIHGIVRSLEYLIAEKERISDDYDERILRLNKLFEKKEWTKYAIEMQKEVDLMKREKIIPRFTEVKSVKNEGIKESDVLLSGVWKSVATKQSGKLEFEFIIENVERFSFHGSITIFDSSGFKVFKTKVKGDWAKALDTEKKLFMGIHLNYVTDEYKHEEIIIPFHSIVGNSIIGVDHTGVQYVSRNVEPRPFGI